jgi:hypothetical protein
MAPAERTFRGLESWLTVDAVNTNLSKGRGAAARKPKRGIGAGLIKQAVLYLMIVNMLTEAELVAVSALDG